MRKLFPLIWVVLAACVAAAPAARAQSPNPDVSVRGVKFSYPRVDGQQGTAMETEIELDVRGTTAAGHNPRFVDDVRVALMLAVQTRGRAGADFQYYYADAEFVTLEAGTRTVRFYLPPEVVKRDGLSGDAYAFYVELARAGQVLPPQRGNLSETLRDRARFEVFQQKVTDARSTTDGILVEQHSFMTGLRDARDASSVVRKAGREVGQVFDLPTRVRDPRYLAERSVFPCWWPDFLERKRSPYAFSSCRHGLWRQPHRVGCIFRATGWQPCA